MKRDKKTLLYFLLLVALILAFLFGYYGKVIMHPNSYLFGSEGDGIKNYYTYAYYIENNKSIGNFEGMNYPYGESIMYTDCHPILAFMMKSLHSIIPGISNYSIGIVNFLMLLSIFITAIILYLLFRKLKVEYLLAVLGAIGITVMSPQIFRLGGHYALSYSFFIPLTIYLIVLYEKSIKRNRLLVILSLCILLFYFIHAYLGMIAATLVFTYTFIRFLSLLIKEKKFLLKQHIGLLLASVLPVILFYLFVKITDTHSGRSTNPGGILDGHADPSTVFLPICSPFESIKNKLFPHMVQNWEGWSYIGLGAILVLLFYIIVSLISSVKSRRPQLSPVWIDNPAIRNLFIASILILLFSLFVPFRFHHESWINHFSIIKQFRAIGRFAWVFYFVTNIMLICVLNAAFKKLAAKKRRFIGYALIVLVPLFLIYEGLGYHTFVPKDITKSPNLFDLNQTSASFKSDISTLDAKKYQAILPFPFFYIGSENYGAGSDVKICKLAFLYSYHLKLPFIGSFLSHTSIRESKNIWQLLASNFYFKNYQIDLNSKKPFLLICLNNKTSGVENNYISQAKLLVAHEEYNIYEINPEVFFHNTAGEELSLFNEKKSQLFRKNGFLVSDTTLYFSFTDFAQAGCDISFTGNNGSLSAVQKGYHMIFSIGAGQLVLHKKYTARFWMYCGGENDGQDQLSGWLFFQKKKGENIEWLNPLICGWQSNEITDKWTLVELSFENTDSDAAYELVLKGDELAEETFYLDDLLIYDSDLLIYRLDSTKQNTTLFKNNHRIVMP